MTCISYDGVPIRMARNLLCRRLLTTSGVFISAEHSASEPLLYGDAPGPGEYKEKSSMFAQVDSRKAGGYGGCLSLRHARFSLVLYLISLSLLPSCDVWN